MLSFPAGKHDDQVDALGLLGQLLDQMVPGQKPKVPVKPKPDSGYRPLSLGERPLVERREGTNEHRLRQNIDG